MGSRRRQRALPTLHARFRTRGEVPGGHAVLLLAGSGLRYREGEGGEALCYGGGGEGYSDDRYCDCRAFGRGILDSVDAEGAQLGGLSNWLESCHNRRAVGLGNTSPCLTQT